MRAGTNCIKIGLPGKLILSKRKGLLKILSENRFSGKTYFYTIASRPAILLERDEGEECEFALAERIFSFCIERCSEPGATFHDLKMLRTLTMRLQGCIV